MYLIYQINNLKMPEVLQDKYRSKVRLTWKKSKSNKKEFISYRIKTIHPMSKYIFVHLICSKM